MKYIKEYWVCHTTSKKDKNYMIKNTKEQMEKCKYSKSEWWFYYKLKDLKYKYWINFQRQKRFWYRIFDFYIKSLWIAIEIDWGYHIERKEKDERYDKWHKEQFWIEVIRVRNFNEWDAYEAIEKIKKSDSFWLRKTETWINHNLHNEDKDKLELEKEIKYNLFDPNVFKKVFDNIEVKETKINKWRQNKKGKQYFIDNYMS